MWIRSQGAAARSLRLAIFVGGVSLVGLLLHQLGVNTIAGLLRRASPTLAVILVVRGIYICLRAIALVGCLPVGTLRLREAIRVRLAGETLEVLTLTGPFLSEPGKAWLLTRRGLAAGDAFGAVLVEYFFYSMLAAWMGAAAFVLIRADALPPWAQRAAVAYIGAVAATTAIIVYAAVTGQGVIAPAARQLRGSARLVSAIATGEAALLRVVANARVALVLGVQIAAHVLLALEAWLVFRAVGSALPATAALVFEGLAKLVDVAFFFVPGQLGAQEAFYEVAALALGAIPAAGVTLSLIRRMRAVLVAAVGLLTMWQRPNLRSG